MPVPFGPRDLHLRVKRDGLTFEKPKFKNEKKFHAPRNAREKIAAKIRAVTEGIALTKKNVEKEIAELRKKFFSAVAAVTRPLKDPLTVGGTAVVAFSLTMMMREELFKAYQNYSAAVAAQEAERDARHHALHVLLQDIKDDPFVMTDEGLFVMDALAYDRPERIVFVLNDAPKDQLPALFTWMRGRGLHVDYALLADADADRGFSVEGEEDANGERAATTIVQPVESFRSAWNREHWEEEQLQYRYSDAEKQELIYEVLHRFTPAKTSVTGMQNNVRVLYRQAKKDREYKGANSYLVRLQNGCEKNPWCAMVHVDYHKRMWPAPRPVPEFDKRFIAKQD